jgi:putative endopeptidase
MNSKKISAVCSPLLAMILCISMLAQSGVNLSMVDKTCQPCEDFYKYANGGWLKNNTIPATDPMWSRGSEIIERTRLTLREILEESAKKTNVAKGSDEQLIGAYYAACANEAKIEADGASALSLTSVFS